MLDVLIGFLLFALGVVVGFKLDQRGIVEQVTTPQPARSFRPFTQKQKHEPKINSDEKAYLKEQGR